MGFKQLDEQITRFLFIELLCIGLILFLFTRCYTNLDIIMVVGGFIIMTLVNAYLSI